MIVAASIVMALLTGDPSTVLLNRPDGNAYMILEAEAGNE